jgi:hypothetical protein
VLLKIVYLLTCRVLGLAILVFRGDLAKDAELLVLRYQNAVLRRHVGRVRYLGGDFTEIAFTERAQSSHDDPRRGRLLPEGELMAYKDMFTVLVVDSRIERSQSLRDAFQRICARARPAAPRRRSSQVAGGGDGHEPWYRYDVDPVRAGRLGQGG